MNIEYANIIALPKILNKTGQQPMQQDDQFLVYHSPFGTGAGAELHVCKAENTWFDTALQSGGGPVDFVRAHLLRRGERSSDADALHWLKFSIGYPSMLEMISLPETGQQENQYALRFKTALLEKSLLRYVRSLGIDAAAAQKFLKQVYIQNAATGREFLAVAVRNEEGGWAFYNPNISAMIGPEAITFIRGKKYPQQHVHIFYTVFDYLVVTGGQSEDDSIILNSYRCMDNAAAYIRGYGYRTLSTWFPNDQHGGEAAAAFRWLCGTEEDLRHRREILAAAGSPCAC